ncbi:MAG TPA: CBS domain-containing protein [Baekduia sp.]|nr:CBS domain-containing protein [Baekduia sp.]
MSTIPETSLATGSWRSPAWEHATVADAMGAPAILCPADTPLVVVARTMATRHVHAVIVAPAAGQEPSAWRVVSDRALAAAGATAAERTAGEVAEQPREAAEPDWPLDRAARVMAEHGVTHLVVVDPHGKPVGMLSTLDLAGVVAWSRA